MKNFIKFFLNICARKIFVRVMTIYNIHVQVKKQPFFIMTFEETAIEYTTKNEICISNLEKIKQHLT